MGAGVQLEGIRRKLCRGYVSRISLASVRHQGGLELRDETEGPIFQGYQVSPGNGHGLGIFYFLEGEEVWSPRRLSR